MDPRVGSLRRCTARGKRCAVSLECAVAGLRGVSLNARIAISCGWGLALFERAEIKDALATCALIDAARTNVLRGVVNFAVCEGIGAKT